MRHLVLLALSLGVVHARPGCLIKDYKFDPVVTDGKKPFSAANVAECQQGCADAKDGCKFWSFFEQDAPNSCWHEKESANPIYAKGAVAGPSVCSEEPIACEETAPASWPENYETATESNKAWNGGYQPAPLQCWPLKDNGEVELCADEGAKVVSDMATGWPGKCEYLFAMPATIKDQTSCETSCLTNSSCAVWQWTDANSCWQGVGSHCFERNSDGFSREFKPVASQRIIHGEVRDLMSYSSKTLPEKDMVNIFTMFYWEEKVKAAKTQEDREIIFDEAADNCRNLCASHIYCTWWQLDSKKGCWIEDPWVDGKFKRSLPYPVVKNSFTANADIFKGGLLQHVCQKPMEAPVSEQKEMAVVNDATPATKDEGGFPWWGILLIVLAVIGILGAIIYALMSGKKDAPRKKRALKTKENLDLPLAAPETPVETVVAPLPTFQQFMPMPQLVQQQPQVRQFQPLQQYTTATTAPAMTVAAPTYAQSTVLAQQPMSYAARQPVYQQPSMAQGNLFRALDANGDGVITRDEFVNAMR